MTQAIAETPKTQIAEYSRTAVALAELRQKYENLVLAVETKDGMETAIKARAELRTYYVDLEKLRVKLKAPSLERTRLIDAEAKMLDAELRRLHDPIDVQIKAEQTRKEREKVEREAAEAKARAGQAAKDEADRAERATRQAEADRVAAEQAERDRLLRAESERLEAEKREIERRQNELLDGNAMLAKFVERFGRRREFSAVVKAINVHLGAK